MKYFIMCQGKVYNRLPDIKGWYGKLDRHSIQQKGINSDERFMFYINVTDQTVMPDVMWDPVMMVSETMREAMDMYEKRIIYKELFLLDAAKNRGYLYYLPFLPVVRCFLKTDGSMITKDKIKSGVIDLGRLWNRHIIEAEEVDFQCVVVSLDFAESVLRKGITGFDLIEMCVG